VAQVAEQAEGQEADADPGCNRYGCPRENRVRDVKTYRTMTEAVEDLKRRGFAASFEWQKGAFLEARTGRTFAPDDLTIVEHHRFEGASNPDDMSVVYAIEATDGTRGTVADAFGTYANPDLGEFLKRVRMREKL